MKKTMWWKASLVVLALGVSAWGQSDARQPQIGYVYPAGGQQGDTVYVVAGGQFLRGASEVYLSGPGVRAEIVKYYRGKGNIDRDERELLISRMTEVRDARLKEAGIELPPARPAAAGQNRPAAAQARPAAGQERPGQGDKAGQAKAPVKMVEHPLLENLEGKSLAELRHIREILFAPRAKQQQNRQLAEMVLVRVRISPSAARGDRELRLMTPMGLTNPVVFQVDQLPETWELEPNGENAGVAGAGLPGGARAAALLEVKPVELPVVLNGQVYPGDVDRFRFRAQQGQNLVIEVHARSLVPYLADAVPGWFQAVVSLYDEQGNEVAYADEYRFDPDPVLHYEITRTGVYTLEIYDAIYRGREDFVYRVSVSERPFVTRVYPLVFEAGAEADAEVGGWNLDQTRVRLSGTERDEFVRHATCQSGQWTSNRVAYGVTEGKVCESKEENDSIETAQAIEEGAVVNGLIDGPGDVDVYSFRGRKGETVALEVYARRLHSPVDSLVRVTDASGEVVAWNDDYVQEEKGYLHKDATGLLTHHADSYVLTELPASGTYYVHMSDSQGQGGAEYGYALRVGEARPDFALRMTPSSLSIPNGGSAAFCMHVLRKDGFDGEIQVVLREPTTGFTLTGGRIPAGCDRICMTLQTPGQVPDRAVSLRLEGVARIEGKSVTRPVVPAEDMMQAFLYRHLVPSQELLVAVLRPRWRLGPYEVVGRTPLQIRAGETATVRVRGPVPPAMTKIDLALVEPPAGVSLGDVSIRPGGLTFQLVTDADAIEGELRDNLILEATAEMGPSPQEQQQNPQAKPRKVPLGSLPAIGIEIVVEKDAVAQGGV